MPPSSIIRISGPRRPQAVPQPKVNVARELMTLAGKLDGLMAGLPMDEPPKLIGVPFRVLAALPRRKAVLARDLAMALGLDAGHLSRILSKLEHHSMIERASTADRRQSAITLTAFGRYTMRRNHQRREAALAGILEELDGDGHKALAKSLVKANEILERLEET